MDEHTSSLVQIVFSLTYHTHYETTFSTGQRETNHCSTRAYHTDGDQRGEFVHAGPRWRHWTGSPGRTGQNRRKWRYNRDVSNSRVYFAVCVWFNWKRLLNLTVTNWLEPFLGLVPLVNTSCHDQVARFNWKTPLMSPFSSSNPKNMYNLLSTISPVAPHRRMFKSAGAPKHVMSRHRCEMSL